MESTEYFSMNMHHEGIFYLVSIETAENQSAEVLDAVQAVTTAASALVKLVTEKTPTDAFAVSGGE